MSDQRAETPAGVSDWIFDGLRFYKSLAFRASKGEELRTDGVAKALSAILGRVRLPWLAIVENYGGHVRAVEMLLRLKYGPRWVQSVGPSPVPESDVADFYAEVVFSDDVENWFGEEFFQEVEQASDILEAVRAERLALRNDKSPVRVLPAHDREPEPPIGPQSGDAEKIAHREWYKRGVKRYIRQVYVDYLKLKGVQTTAIKVKAFDDRERKRPKNKNSAEVSAEGPSTESAMTAQVLADKPQAIK
jgi:hypothetical protein